MRLITVQQAVEACRGAHWSIREHTGETAATSDPLPLSDAITAATAAFAASFAAEVEVALAVAKAAEVAALVVVEQRWRR